ncbi:hypothetical protein CVT25_013183 [Psilocybe cyanescens]|uniref:Uncharacterized protein n=1 Tax=Psilocybe cyanescens TaxID=93625 RepID=A0A409XCI6_PSICY|nr:hypothetical protein CVT25_013183 [Psilocybe cyanescens]
MAACKSSQVSNRPFVEIAEEHIRVPPNPDLSNEEHLNVHVEVVATMDQLGASYKDAANHLYLAKVTKDHVHTNTNAADMDVGVGRLETTDSLAKGRGKGQMV